MVSLMESFSLCQQKIEQSYMNAEYTPGVIEVCDEWRFNLHPQCQSASCFGMQANGSSADGVTRCDGHLMTLDRFEHMEDWASSY